MFVILSHGNTGKVQKSHPQRGQSTVFIARQITTGTLRAAFAVLQLATPEASLPEFRKFVATGRLHSAIGITIGLFDRRDYIHALFRACAERSPGQPMRLKVTDITHGDSISTALLIEMVEAIEDFARAEGCERLTIEAGRGGKAHGLPMADILITRGFSRESLVMTRRI